MSLSILVPLDGSAVAEHALPAALAMARRAGGRLHLFRVCLPVAADEDAVVRRRRRRQRAEALLGLRRLGRRLAAAWHVPIRTRVRAGPAAESVLREAERLGAGVIVLTTCGLGKTGRRWIGSVADEIVHRASCAVLLLPPGRVAGITGRFRRILLPIEPGADPGRVLAGTVLVEAVDGVTYGALPLHPSPPAAHASHLGADLFSPDGGATGSDSHGAPGRPLSAPSLIRVAREFGADLIAVALPAKFGSGVEPLGPLLEPLVLATPVPLLLQRSSALLATDTEWLEDARRSPDKRTAPHRQVT